MISKVKCRSMNKLEQIIWPAWKVIYPCLVVHHVLPGPAVVHGPVVDVAGNGRHGVGSGYRDQVEAVLVHQREVGGQHLVIVGTLQTVPELRLNFMSFEPLRRKPKALRKDKK